jgi:hypothetical protein
MIESAVATQEHGTAVPPITLSGTAANEHFARFYLHEETLVDSVAVYVIQHVGEGAAAIVIATEQHLAAFQARWAELEFDAAAAGSDLRLFAESSRFTAAPSGLAATAWGMEANLS